MTTDVDQGASGFAIIGYAAHFPGAADAEGFWEVLRQGRDAISEIPGDRWNMDDFYDPDPDTPGKMVTRRAGLIEDVGSFDAPFFGVSTREAVFMDPQHRLLLETTWQAVEHSNTAPSTLAGTKTGVFIGISTTDYLTLLTNAMTVEDIDAYLAIGNASAAAAGRISYRLGLVGPAVSVDTACSSSLVAVHQACQALRLRECDLALTGGVGLLMSPTTMINFSRAHMLAPDGRCKTFDAAADGYVRGEGCGVIVVKRLDDAIRDGDRIRAVIRGSAVNQDGASGGLTVPNGIAQQRVIADALHNAGVTARDIDYLEAHGTGTSLGDPIELQAAGAAFASGRDATRPLLVGSVKTNIGHLEASAGIAGLIKVILSLEHQELPKHLNFQNPSPHIPWDRIPVRVVAETTPWVRNGRARIAGVSSFGFTGTNAHVVVAEAPSVMDPDAVPLKEPDEGRSSILPLSARTPTALVALAHRYREWLAAHPNADLADVCLTAGAGRSHFGHRAALILNSTASATELLEALADDRPASGLVRGACSDPPKTAWLFPGQGSQYVGMARNLFDAEPVFAETLTRCAGAAADVLERPLLDVIFGPDTEDELRHTSYAQPALFAVEMGLARLWQSWGLEPDVVVGHSVGQYTAACVAGAFSLEDGAQLMAERGRLFGSLPPGGRMVAVFAAADRVESLIDDHPRLSVAAYNGANTVLSGPAEDLERAIAGLVDEEVRCDWLDTSHAFHSALLDPILDEFEQYLGRFEFASPQKTLVCNRTGGAVARDVTLDGSYWRRHARQPVEFAKSVRTLADLGCRLLLEVGPQPVLSAAALRAWPDPANAPRAIASMRRNANDHNQITEALADTYIAGHRPEFVAHQHGRGHKVDLPTYPFERQTYWFEGRKARATDAVRTETVRLLEEERLEELAALVGDPHDADDATKTVGMLQRLAAQHNRERNVQSLAETRYEICWEKLAVSGPPPTRAPGGGVTWLLLADDADTIGPLLDVLTAHGHRHRIVGLPQSDADEEHLQAELRDAAAEQPTLRILHLAGLDPGGAASTRSLDRLQHRVLRSTQRFIRTTIASKLDLKIWLITRGAQHVTGSDTVSPTQSCLWGLGRTVATEMAKIWGGLADLSAGGGNEWPGLIAHILHGPATEDQIALRDNATYVARVSRRTDELAPVDLGLRSDATYLVTGGLGAIGLDIAEYLAARGAGHLVLTGRRGPSDAAQQRIDAIRDQFGCQIKDLAADVANRDDVTRLLSTVRAELPPLAGIVHAAGEFNMGPVDTLDDAMLNQVFTGKVWGSWHLSQAAVDMKLDFFLSISSISALWPSRGWIYYACANAFLDGLAWWQRQHGIPGTTVALGLWPAGMADHRTRDTWAALGVAPLNPAPTLEGMAKLIASPAPYGILAKIDWPRFLPYQLMLRKRNFHERIAPEVPTNPVGRVSVATTPLIDQLKAAPAQQRRALILGYMRDAVAEVTKIDPTQIRDDVGFFDLGIDSLMAVNLHRRFEQGLGRELPVTLAMDYPRLNDAAEYLLRDVLGLGAPASAESTAEPVALATVRTDEPIAIVGLACRFPGAPDPDAFWEVLSNGVDAIREIPDDRFDIDEYYDPDPDAPGKIYTRYGGFLDAVDGFDPEFFGISPRETVWIDPQQRLMLEIAWEGLESAGYSPAALRGSRSGVFVGVCSNEYSHVLAASTFESIEAQFGTGNSISVIAGRVAFALGLEGPAMAVDTACSSSLVAIHQACHALHAGDCDLALAGGVNVLLSPASLIATSRAKMLSPDGRCKTFDAAADGYVRSEGCGVLVLKRLSDAERDGDRIRAVIQGSAVNQDGASSGLTVPNGGAQQRLIATTLARAGVAGRDVDYLEAHGTGTSLGDPIEVQAAAAVYGAGREADDPLLIGSVKTNVGHLESAAGVAGVIKVVLALQHEMLPQNLHFKTPSPHIPWNSLPVRVLDKAAPWQGSTDHDGRPRRAGISSFGFSGTNAHVLVEEAPQASPHDEVAAPEPTAGDERAEVLAFSARSASALTGLAQRYATWLSEHPDADLADVCFTAGVGRSHFEHRAALVVNSVQQAQELLSGLAENRLGPGALRGECGDPPKTAWFFTGQGSQYPGMARELFDSEPVFAETVKRCAQAVEEITARPLLEVVFNTESDGENVLRHTSFAQPALFAIEMGLARLWQSWGIEPDVVLGHSVGQYAAACVAGVFSLEDGARLIAQRGRVFGDLPDGGRMVAMFADARQIEDIADKFPRVSVAAYNGSNTVLSGPGEDLEQIVAGNDGIRCNWLETSHAFHSELMEPALSEFETHAARMTFGVPTVPLICNRTGAVITADNPLDAQYWRKHSRQPVRFAESVRTVAELGCSVVMELGPQPILTGAALQIWPESLGAPRAVVSLRKGTDARRQITEALAAAYAAGCRADFAALHHQSRNRVELPTYPFQRRRFWPKTSGLRADGAASSGILGSGKDLASGDVVYTSLVSLKSQPWLSDHVIYGTVVVPGATYAAMALAAVGAPAQVREVFFYEPIILGEKTTREVQLTLHPVDEGGWAFRVDSRPYGERDAEWSLNADGKVKSGLDEEGTTEPAPEREESIDALCERLARTRPQQLFEALADMELTLGPTWSTSLKSLWVGDGESVGDIAVGPELAEQLASEPVHPVLLDLCTGVASPASPMVRAAAELGQAAAALFLPLQYGRVELNERMPRRFYCRARWQPGDHDGETQAFDLDFVDRDGRRLGGIREFKVKRAPREALLRGLGGDATRNLYSIGWREVAASTGAGAGGAALTWLVAGFDKLAADLSGCLRSSRTTDLDSWAELFAQAQDRGVPVSGIVWGATARPGAEESSTEFNARLETEIGELLRVVHTLLAPEAARLPAGLWIVTQRAVATESGEPVDPVQAALWGLGRSIVAEQPQLRCRLVDHDGSDDAVRALAGLLATQPEESEVALRQGKLLVPRLLPWARGGHLTVPRAADYSLEPTERGAINNLRLAELEVSAPFAGHVQIRVEAAGLNFRDVLNVLGLYPGYAGPVGGDVCGIVTAVGPGVTEFEVGQRVFGATAGSMVSRANVPVRFLAGVPDGIDATAAASTPTAMLTAFLAFDWAKLGPGDRVLIHAASGGVGLAAIQVARQRGATVFATASEYKRATLHKIGVEHIYDSRSTDFADQILADTDGAGVDVVLNSLTNEGFIEATLRATAQQARFVEIAKRDIWTHEQMAAARPDIDYEIVALDLLMMQDPERIRGLMSVLADGLASGELVPPALEIYPLADAKTAFRRMQQARHIGKIVLQMPKPLHGRGDRSYLITGGLGALGMHTAAHLAQLGAGDIVLTSRRAPDADAQREIDAITERYRCRIHTFAADVGDEHQLAAVLEQIRAELPPLAGVAHLAGVLDDALLPQQSLARFRNTMRPKSLGAWHLHRLTKNEDLDFFVMYSSGASVLGAAGQANYATANALLDGLVAYRKAQGLPASSINFGPWAHGGMASSDAARANLGARGLIPLAPDAALNAVSEIVAHGIAQVVVVKANWQRVAKLLSAHRPPVLEYVLPSDVVATPVDSALLRQLQEVPRPQLAGFLTEHLQSELQHFLGLAQPPAASSRFLELGMDSLMAVELRNRLLGQFGGAFTITATAVFDYPTITSFAEHLAEQIATT
ncbi:polyketide synthase [Mycobacterium gordonae]|uniref:type I polyketide synthase n=1 Tax=Mycobacterium paragordonae TaxID=1389713 RepID=UPI0007EFE818|nr:MULTISPECIES: type I polyketide synthase [Mycobacterium]OBK61279.1 polyketide synthase [Mycobacterium gordonae]